MGESDPVFMRKYGEELKQDPGKWIDSCVWHGKAHSWEKIPWVMKEVHPGMKSVTSERSFGRSGNGSRTEGHSS